MAQRFSQNGWIARATTEHFTRFTAGGNGWWAANDDVAVVFGEFIRRFVAEVEPIAGPVLDDWSYANRLVRGSTTVVSNHGSATAIDLNALQHPRGVHNTFTVAKRAAMRRIRNQITDASGRPVLRLGLEYTGTVDDMHVEVDTTAARIKEAADKIKHQATLQEDDVSFADTHKLTEADVKAYGGSTKVGDRKSYDEIVRFPPATARLRAEVAAQSAATKASIDALTKAVTALAAGSAKDVKAAFDSGIKGLEQAIADLDVKLVVTDTDNG
jgi:hypothetical protein